MDQPLVSKRWDAEYRRGRYAEEPPLPFVADILAALAADASIRGDTGLYVGCGNGRNYLPLVDADLRLYGLDVSEEALRQLAGRRPHAARRLVCADFRAFVSPSGLAYLVALQVFQHGGADDVATYFANTATALRPGGLFFLRVNAASTEVFHDHAVIERNDRGGRTVRYEAGPKRGLAVHFYGREELLHLTDPAFEPVLPLRELTRRREAPQTGSWAQWEAIWRRR